MIGYKCDRCGQWHSGRAGGYLYKNPSTKEDEDDFGLDDKAYDFCPDCFRSVVSYVKNSGITSD